MFKPILKGFVGVLVPFLFSALTGKWADFPLTAEVFLEFTLWIVGTIIGGWQLNQVNRARKGDFSK